MVLPKIHIPRGLLMYSRFIKAAGLEQHLETLLIRGEFGLQSRVIILSGLVNPLSLYLICSIINVKYRLEQL